MDGNADHARSRAALTREILITCTRDLGFALAGICAAEPSARQPEYLAWLADHKHGEMAYLSTDLPERFDPRTLVPGARSIIMVADRYATRSDNPDAHRRWRGRIARYARGQDYHAVIKKRLHTLVDDLRARFPGNTFRACVDSAPFLEREHAARAGLGWIAKNSLLIHPRLGSYVLLGGIITTLDLDPTAETKRTPDHCGSCTRCIDACPTAAITPYSVDASRCISYLTIEHRSPIREDLHAAIGDWIYGCDICQEVCPHNSPRPDGAGSSSPNPKLESRRSGFDLLEVLGWTDADRIAAFTRSPLKRAKLDMMRRNAEIVRRNNSGNAPSPDPRHTPTKPDR